jgi:hypothetical protein
MKPKLLTVQPNVRLGFDSILLRAMGKTTPPTEDPAMVNPMAAALFTLKY